MVQRFFTNVSSLPFTRNLEAALKFDIFAVLTGKGKQVAAVERDSQNNDQCQNAYTGKPFFGRVLAIGNDQQDLEQKVQQSDQQHR
jgi:extradiol dioxygenase family protein